MYFFRQLSVFAGLLAILSATASAGELIQNGSFEFGKSTDTPGWYPGVAAAPLGLSPPGQGIDYWSLGGTDAFRWYASSAAHNYPYYMLLPQNGDRYVNILGAANNAYYVAQSFSVLAGGNYNVSFWEAYRAVLGGGGGKPEDGDGLDATVGATLTATLIVDTGILTGQMGSGLPGGTSFSGSGTNMLTMITANNVSDWTNFTFSFIPSASGTATLKFFATEAYSHDGTYLDNVSVQGPEIPEPGSLVLLVVGLTSVLVYAWRKRK